MEQAVKEVKKEVCKTKLGKGLLQKYHIGKTLIDNYQKVRLGHFSIVLELYCHLSKKGYQLPCKAFRGAVIHQIISLEESFAQYLIDAGEDPYNCQWYNHTFADGAEYCTKAYPDKQTYLFANFLNGVWISEHWPAFEKYVSCSK